MASHRTRDYAGKQYTPDTGSVHFHSTSGQFPAVVTDLVHELTRVVEHRELPEHADYLVTRTALNATIERAAARLGATPVVLPEAAEWLRGRIEWATSDNRNVVVVWYTRTDIH